MRLSLFLFCLYVLICVGYVQAQNASENAAISSLISPQIVLKDVIDESTTVEQQNIVGDIVKESPWKERDIQFNVADSSMKGRFIYQLKPRVLRFGFEVGGKSANGYIGLFDGGDISSDITANVFLIHGWIPEDNDTISEADTTPFVRGQWAGVRVGYQRGKYKLVNSEVPRGLDDRNLMGLSGRARYSILLPWKFFAGVSVGAAKQNNYSNLDQVEVTKTMILSPSNQNSQIARMVVAARDGNYEDFVLLNADIDILWIPNFPEDTPEDTSVAKTGLEKKTYGIGAFLRVKNRSGAPVSDITYEPGLGFYLFDLPDEKESSGNKLGESSDGNESSGNKSPESFISKMAGGITVSYDSTEKDLKFGLITSYNF